MPQKPNISSQDTTQFLQEKLNTEISALTLLSGGEWSQAYSFIHDGKKYVLRWCHSSESFEKDAFAGTFNTQDLPVPKVIDSGKHFDTHFAISEFVQGSFLEKLSADELDQTLPAVLKMLDALRTADLSQTTGYGAWDKNGKGSHASWQEYLLDVKKDSEQSITHGWSANLTSSSFGTKMFDQLYAQFETLVEKCPESRELIHADLINCNVMISQTKISAVIDWQCSLYGDSLYDIAWFLYYSAWYPQFKEVNLREKLLSNFESNAQSVSHIKERLACYYLHIGLGSIAYNAFKQDWKAAEEAGKYTTKIVQSYIK